MARHLSHANWFQSTVAVAALLLACPAWSQPTTADVTVLFQNDGNWTTHGSRPSALFVNQLVNSSDAAGVCASYGENLLNECSSLSQELSQQLSYQIFLGNVKQNTPFWTNCSLEPAAGLILQDGSTSAVSSNSLSPVLCTNSAPLVDAVDTDYSIFPRINVTSNGTTFEGLRDHMAFRFLGIPYAEPPLGDLRFRYTAAWNQTSFVNSTSYSPACLQYGYFDSNSSYGLNAWGNSEDCLYLNVYTPYIPAASNDTLSTQKPSKPVMLWIHGGGSTQGTGADSTFDGASLASRSDVVVVTINYRLNIFGGLSLDDSLVTGNYFTTDKIAALGWVRDFIAGFGGNPHNVTIFGQSSGASSVIDLLMAPQAKGLFQNAIIQSGGDGHTMSSSTAAASVLPYINELCGNSTGTERLRCLQAVPAESLLNITYSGVTLWRAVIDGLYTLDYPLAQAGLGQQFVNSVNVMTGFMPEEYQSLGTTILAPNATNFTLALNTLATNSPSLSQAQADAVLASNLWLISNNDSTTTSYPNGSTVYSSVYNASIRAATDGFMTCAGATLTTISAASYAYQSLWVYQHQRAYALSYYDFYDLCSFPVNDPQPYYRCHSGDLYEVFGTYYLFNQPIREAADVYYTNAVQDMWGSFARTGNPNVEAGYLAARGYASTEAFFANGTWAWPEFKVYRPQVADLQFPGPGYTTLPDQRQCEVLMPFMTTT